MEIIYNAVRSMKKLTSKKTSLESLLCGVKRLVQSERVGTGACGQGSTLGIKYSNLLKKMFFLLT